MKNISIVLLVLLIGSCGTATTNEKPLKYTLTPDKIADVYMNQFREKHNVSIRLAEPYKSEFANLTGKNIGKKLQIIFNGKVLTSAVIEGKIQSGYIGVNNATAEEAKTLTKELKGAP